MIIFISILILVIGSKIANTGEFFDNNFNVNQANALKGLCAIYVVFHHLCTYFADVYSSFLFFECIGFLMVGMFFFISGYGLMYGVKNKENYLKGFFTKRLLTILIPYYIIDLFYIYAKDFVGMLNVKYIVLSIFGYHLWYVMAIIVMYIGFYLCFTLFKQKGIIIMSVYTLLYIVILYILNKFYGMADFGLWWYNSIPCFALGMWYCNCKDDINGFFKKYYVALIILTLIIFCPAMYYTVAKYGESTLPLLLTEIVCSATFSIFIILISMKMQIGNKLLNLCGRLSLELYLSHALFIFFLRSNMVICGYTVYVTNNLLYLTAIIIGTFVFSYAVHIVSQLILTPIKRIKS
ncbi:MAG: acyltransferase [Clostridia bacterium]|nr:acyltransferase [Clostridia bacterium]